MQCVDEVDETAQVIGCINTVVRDGERLLGYNSDGLGALGALRAAGADPEGSHTLVLGSGGAARAIAVTLSRTAPPQRLAILGVQQDELDRLVTDVRQRGKSEVYGAMLTEDSLADELARAEMLLHCSPIGMHPHQDACLVPQRLLRERTGRLRRRIQSAAHPAAAMGAAVRLSHGRRTRNVPRPGARAVRTLDGPQTAARRDAESARRKPACRYVAVVLIPSSQPMAMRIAARSCPSQERQRGAEDHQEPP